MRQHLTHRHMVLAMDAELWPIRGHRGIKVEQALIGSHEKANGRDTFTHRKSHAAGGFRPRNLVRGLLPADVDNGHTLHDESACCPAFTSLIKIRSKGIRYGAEAGRYIAAN